MIAAPAAAARLLTRRIGRMLALSVAFGVGAALLGLWASRALDLAAGGAHGGACGLLPAPDAGR